MKLTPRLLNENNEESLPFVIVVVDPRGDWDDIGDIMFKATPEEVYLAAKGTQENPRDINVKFYIPQQRFAALRDAQSRLQAKQTGAWKRG